MRSAKTVLLVVLALMGTQVWAGETGAMPLDRWKVKPDAPGSTVGAGGIICRIYSPVVCEDLGLELSEIRVSAEWLNPLDSVDSGLHLKIKYDDWVEEGLDGVIPRGTRRQELVYRPRWGAGRRVQALELGHGQTGTEIKVSAVNVIVETTAVSMSSSSLGGAQLHAGDNLHNDILIAEWDSPSDKLPYLTGVTSPQITVVAAVSCGVTWILERESEMELRAVDADGNWLKTFKAPVEGKVQTSTFSLEGVDLAKVAKLVFLGDGTGVNIAIRRITIGPAPTPPAAGGDLKTINDRFGALLEQWLADERLSLEVLAQLADLVKSYRALE